MGSNERRQINRTTSPTARKVVKSFAVAFVLLFCYQLIMHYSWPDDVLSNSGNVLTSQDWQPLLHLLTCEYNLFDLLPLHTQAHILPKDGVTLILFTGYRTLIRLYSNRSSDYTFDRAYVSLMDALLKGRFSRVISVHPFLRNSSHIHLPSVTKYGIGTAKFLLPAPQLSSISGEHVGHLEFCEICLCEIGRSLCTLPHVSHITRQIPANLCSLQHTFVYEQLFDFVVESELSPAGSSSASASHSPTVRNTWWWKSESDATDPTFSVISIDMTYFGNPPIMTSTETTQRHVRYDEPHDATWKTELLAILTRMYEIAVLRNNDQTSLRRVRSILDSAFLFSSPFSLIVLPKEDTVTGFPPGLCGSSAKKIRQLNMLNFYPTDSDIKNSSEQRSACMRLLPLLMGFVNFTDTNPEADKRTSELLSELWFWLCSQENFARFRQLTMWTVCLLPTAEFPQRLKLCPRAAPTMAAAQPDNNGTSERFLLLARLENIMRNIPKPRFIVLNSDEMSDSAIVDNHLAVHLCWLIDSIFHPI